MSLAAMGVAIDDDRQGKPGMAHEFYTRPDIEGAVPAFDDDDPRQAYSEHVQDTGGGGPGDAFGADFRRDRLVEGLAEKGGDGGFHMGVGVWLAGQRFAGERALDGFHETVRSVSEIIFAAIKETITGVVGTPQKDGLGKSDAVHRRYRSPRLCSAERKPTPGCRFAPW